jgi:hypothetical protein
MKKTIAILCLMPLMAMAQTTTSTSSSETSSRATANNAGNAQSITYNNPAGLNYGGSYTTTVRSTGTAIMGGFAGSFSGDYCGGTAQGALGLVGFSVGAGAPIIDSSCVLLRTYERTMQAAASTPDPAQAFMIRSAALELLAEINPTVRNVFESKGLVQIKATDPK